MKKILLIQTGGTISMQFGKSGTSYMDSQVSENVVKQELPELQQLADIDILGLFYEDSSNLNPEHWKKLANAIAEHYQKYDGFVVLHGTDTMAYTASALSYALKNLTKPVILTGSQVPLVSIRSDARRNLINAVEVATLPLHEVALCFNDKVFRGNRSTKMSIGDFDAFSSPNFLPLAKIGIHIETNFSIDTPRAEFYAEPVFDQDVLLIKLFPGLQSEVLLKMVQAISVKGIVIEAFGAGNMPVSGSTSVIPLLDYCRENAIAVLVTSQAAYDAVDLAKYENGRLALEHGALSAGDMTCEAAITKMMYLYAKYTHTHLVNQQLMIPIAGEMTL
ncbi:asparaginase [bacterium]|nr:MAG: asparaginase [bacterium]